MSREAAGDGTDDHTHAPLAPPHTGPRLVLAVGVFLGVVGLFSLVLTRSGMLGVNFAVYHAAGERVLSGGPLYGVSLPGRPGYVFRYPPVVALGMAPLAFLPKVVGFSFLTAANVVAGLGLGVVLVRVLDARVALERVDRVLILGHAVLAPTVVPSVFFGNLNPLMMTAVAVGLVAVDRGRTGVGGGFLGLAALPKVFPAVVGIYLLRRGHRRALAAATALGVSGLGLGAVVFGPVTSVRYVEMVLFAPTAGAAGAVTDPGAAYLSLTRPLAATGLDGSVRTAAAVVIVALPTAYCYRPGAFETTVGRLCALSATLSATLLALPTYFVYYPLVFYPFVVLVYLSRGRSRWALLAGGSFGSLAVSADAVVDGLVRVGLASEASVTAVTTVYGVLTPPTVGLCLVLLGCVTASRRVA